MYEKELGPEVTRQEKSSQYEAERRVIEVKKYETATRLMAGMLANPKYSSFRRRKVDDIMGFFADTEDETVDISDVIYDSLMELDRITEGYTDFAMYKLEEKE